MRLRAAELLLPAKRSLSTASSANCSCCRSSTFWRSLTLGAGTHLRLSTSAHSVLLSVQHLRACSKHHTSSSSCAETCSRAGVRHRTSVRMQASNKYRSLALSGLLRLCMGR